jgi:hypothetical protein
MIDFEVPVRRQLRFSWDGILHPACFTSLKPLQLSWLLMTPVAAVATARTQPARSRRRQQLTVPDRPGLLPLGRL